jgi:gentisate 1,2-dioxygenase
MAESRKDELAERNLLDELFALRDEQRRLREKSIQIVRGDELPWEQNRQGKMQWYMHPALTDTVINSLIIFAQEIPPGGRSGRQRCQGGQAIYILEGRGFTVIDGVRHEWQAEDVVQLPLRPDGVEFQHFNADPDKPARFLACEPNLVHSLGVDRGSGFEQLEDAPRD